MIERGKYRNKGNTGLSRLSGTKPEPEIKDNQQNIFFLPRKTNDIRVLISFTLYAFLWHKVNNCLIFSFTLLYLMMWFWLVVYQYPENYFSPIWQKKCHSFGDPKQIPPLNMGNAQKKNTIRATLVHLLNCVCSNYNL